jgi:acetyl esterase/lipase
MGGLKAAPLEPGTSTGLFGKAPAYYEVGAPSGLYTGKAPKGITIVVHGGAWALVGPGAVTSERTVADEWRNMGWSSINVTYPACNGLGEIATLEWFYDRAALVAGHLPIGAEGDSAGGELVLLLAEHRPLSFAVSRGGPTDLTSIGNQPAWNPTHAAYDQTGGPQNVYYSAVAAFGSSGLAAMSPALSPSRPSGRVLQAPASTDFLVPPAQLRELGIGTTYVVPGPGSVQWVHGTVTPAGVSGFQATLNRLLNGLS